MATPCSVNTRGGFLNPIFSDLVITICDFQFFSSPENRGIGSVFSTSGTNALDLTATGLKKARVDKA